MKKSLTAAAFVLLLAGCSANSPEESLQEQEEYKSELESLLQTEQVRNQQLSLHLENLDTDIANFERDMDNPNVDQYVSIVETYSNSLTEDLEKLDAFILTYRNDEEVKAGEVVKVRDSIQETIETFDDSVSDLELTDVLERENENIVLANEEIDEAVTDIADAIASDDVELLDTAVNQLKQATEYL